MEEIPEPSKSKQKWDRSKKTRGQYAIERKLALLRALSPPQEHAPNCGQCDACQQWFPYEQLTIDHVDGRTWDLKKLSRWGRVAKYWKEFLAGVRLRPLCPNCNSRDGGGRRYGGSR